MKSPENHLKLLTLGSLAVHGPHGPLTGSAAQPRRLAVLVMIARGGARGTPRAKLVSMLWPDVDDERGGRAIAQALYALRRDLGKDETIVGTQVLQLNDKIAWCDVSEFDAAVARGEHERAVDLYGGPFLESFRLPGAPDFERWADDERTAIAHRYHGALESLAQSAEQKQEFSDAARWWRRRSACDPLDGRVALATMKCLATSGDRLAAIRHAGVFEALVAEELDMPADRDVVALAEALRREAESEITQPIPVEGARAIAVLPFSVIGRSPDPGADRECGDSLAEEIIHALLGISGLRVVARTASFALGDSPTLAALRDLRVTHAVEGSIRRVASGHRITVRLIDTADGTAIWWDRVDCAPEDAPHVYEAAALRLRSALSERR